MKTICFHGTTADNLPSILTHGLLAESEEKIWNCSHDAVYCWYPPSLGDEHDDDEAKKQYAFNEAFGSAQCALGKSTDCRAVVIEFEIEENKLEIDNSCGTSMDHARCFRGDIPLKSIRKISISNDLGLLKGFFLATMIDRDLCNLEFTDLEKKIAKKLADAEIYPEDIEEIVEWETKEF